MTKGKKNIPKKRKSKPTSGSGNTSVNLQRFFPFIIVALGFLLYANTITHGFVLDDDIITRKNSFVNKGIAGIPDIFTHGYLFGFNGKNDQSYRPMVLANLALETQFFGSSPKVHHFFNVVLFAISGLVFFQFLKLIFREQSQWLAFVIALLFVAHPIHTEVVANIKSRDEILSFLCLCGSLLFLMKYVLSGENKNLGISLALYFFCVLSKETGLAMLGLVPFVMYFFTKKNIKQISLITLFYAGIAGLYFLIRVSVMDSMTFEEGMSPINNSLMAAENGIEKFATNVSIMGRYLGLLIFPHPLSFDYSFNQIPIIGLGDWRFLLSFATYIGLAVVAVKGLLTKNPLSFAIIWFVVMLALVSNFITMVGSPMAERFIFGSSVGFCIAIGYLWFQYSGSEKSGVFRPKPLFVFILGGVLLLYSVKTISRNLVWESQESLFLSGLLTAPNSARAQNHYASYLREEIENNPGAPDSQTKAETAIQHYNRALEIYPEYTEASYNLGVLYFTIGRPDNALSAYNRTLLSDPGYINAHNNSGVIYFNRKDYSKAQEHWEAASKLDPDNAQVLGNLGALQQNAGNLTDAIQYYKRALAKDPKNKNVLNNIVKALQSLGMESEALQYQQKLQELQ